MATPSPARGQEICAMSDDPTLPVRDLPRSFAHAVASLRDWNLGSDEPRISYGAKMYSIGLIADLVTVYGDTMGDAPDDVFNDLCDVAATLRTGREGYAYACHGPANHTYASMAECLERLYSAKAAYYRRRAAYRSLPKLT
jgi:hypothetical protein